MATTAPAAGSRFDLPEWVQVLGITVGVLAVLFAVASLYLQVRWSPRAANEKPDVTFGTLATIRRWRPSHYSSARFALDQLIRQINAGEYVDDDERGTVTREDLDRWTLQAGLTCAAFIVPNSLGKANFFRVSSFTRNAAGGATSVHVYSSEFVGVFSPDQLTNAISRLSLRNLGYAEGQPLSVAPAALACVGNQRPVIQSLAKRMSGFDEPERDLGVTHILAIPLTPSFAAISYEDQPVSITVDLRYGRVKSLFWSRVGFKKSTLIRRAEDLANTLGEVEFQKARYEVIYDPIVDSDARGGEPV